MRRRYDVGVWSPARAVAVARFTFRLSRRTPLVSFSLMLLPLRVRRLVVLLLLVGCAPLSPSARTVVAGRPAVAAHDPLAAPWVVRDAGAHRAQVVRVRAVLASEVDGRLRVDTLRSALEVAWSAVPESLPARLAGMVVSYSVAVGLDTAAVPAGVTLPFSFTAESSTDGAQPGFVIPDATSCALPNAAVVQGARDTWLSLPDTLEPGKAWRDSTTYLTCRDDIPLTIVVSRLFVPTGARMRDGQLAVIVQRVTSWRVTGSGLQFGEPLAIQGDGEGTMVLEVALAGGVILYGEGRSELRLEMEGRRRKQRLVQSSTTEIREP